MILAILLLGIAALLTIAIGLALIRQSLVVIHTAVNSNMTRALDEVQQLHKDVTNLVSDRNKALRLVSGLESTEKLSSQLINVVAGIAEQQNLVAQNLKVAQAAVDGVASDLVKAQGVVDDVATTLEESSRRADQVEEGSPPGAAADAFSKPDPTKKNGGP